MMKHKAERRRLCSHFVKSIRSMQISFIDKTSQQCTQARRKRRKTSKKPK
jgi:hypothetical protein